MKSFWQDRVVVITGATSGIGREVATQASALGAGVVGLGRSAVPGLHDGADWVQADVTDVRDRHGALKSIAERWGRIDLLVNNAGIQYYPDFRAGWSEEELRREVELNFIAPIFLISEARALLEKSADPVVVNVSSSLAHAPKESAPIYCATKAALANFSTALRYQFEEQGIRVVNVYPPLVKTAMTEGRNAKGMSAKAAARQMMSKIAGGRDEVYVGKARFIPLLSRFAPKTLKKALRGPKLASRQTPDEPIS